MKIENNSIARPYRFVMDNGIVFGQFYNSYDKLYHLAEYIPYKKVPTIRLCGLDSENFSSSREVIPNKKSCPLCLQKLLQIIAETNKWNLYNGYLSKKMVRTLIETSIVPNGDGFYSWKESELMRPSDFYIQEINFQTLINRLDSK